MARSRIIKPEFFQNEELVALLPIARLLFIGLWQLADRDGRLEDRPGKIKLAVLPADECDVDDLLRQLAEKELIVRYQLDGARYLAIPKFLAHQSPHVSERSKGIPAPPSTENAVQAPDKHRASTVLAPDKHQTNPPHSDSDCGSGCDSESGSDADSHLSPDGNSEKGLPTDSSKSDSEKVSTETSRSAKAKPLSHTEMLYFVYPRNVGKADALKAINAALKIETYETLLQAVQAFSASPMGKAGKYCPYPATWFRKERWKDDRKEWQRSENTPNNGNRSEQRLTGSLAAIANVMQSDRLRQSNGDAHRIEANY